MKFKVGDIVTVDKDTPIPFREDLSRVPKGTRGEVVDTKSMGEALVVWEADLWDGDGGARMGGETIPNGWWMYDKDLSLAGIESTEHWKMEPSYYKAPEHSLDLLDIIEMFDLPFHVANIWKYTLRYKQKNGIEDLRKAHTYLERLIEKERK